MPAEPKFFALDENDNYIEVPFEEVTQAEAKEFIYFLSYEHQTLIAKHKSDKRKYFFYGVMVGWSLMGIFAGLSFTQFR